MKALQIDQNSAAGVVTKLSIYSSTADLLKQTGWKSVKQLVFYHSVLLVFKVRFNESPGYLYDNISIRFVYNTRAAASNSVKCGPEFRASMTLTQRSWRWRAVQNFNILPRDLRRLTAITEFKQKLREWVKTNVSLK